MKLFIMVSICLLHCISIKALDHEKILASMTERGQIIYRQHLELVRHRNRRDNKWLPRWYLEQQSLYNKEAYRLLKEWYLPTQSNESSPSSSSSSLK